MFKLVIEGKEVVVPKYVKDLLENEYGRKAYIDFDYDNIEYSGYILTIYKRTPYQRVDTFISSVERFCRWCERHYAMTKILGVPKETHLKDQLAHVVVTDPIMHLLEAQGLVAYKPYSRRYEKESGYNLDEE